MTIFGDGRVGGLRSVRLCQSLGLSLLFMMTVVPQVHAEKYALLVGINEYSTVRALRGSVNDIERVREILLADLAFDEDHIRTLTDSDATKANLLSALEWLATETRPGDSILWYYSGHGFMVADEDGDEALREAGDIYDEVLVPYDAVPWPRERATDPNPTMLTDDEIANALSGLSGQRVVIVFDSCHSGSATRAVGDFDGRSLYPGYIPPDMPRTRSLIRATESLDLEGSMVFISSASPLQSASDLGEFEGARHGAFSASLLRTIRDEGEGWQNRVSWEDVFNRARSDLLNNGFASQTPSIQAGGSLPKRPIGEFFDPPPLVEIADLDPPQGSFELELESPTYRFWEGENLTLALRSAQSGYLYVFDITPDQRLVQLFPNDLSGPDNRIDAGIMMTVPESGAGYEFEAMAPFGKNLIVAVVTTEPWADADELALPTNFQAVSEDQERGLAEQLQALHEIARAEDPQMTWASQRIVLDVVPADYVEIQAEEWELEEPDVPQVAADQEIGINGETVGSETPVEVDEALAAGTEEAAVLSETSDSVSPDIPEPAPAGAEAQALAESTENVPLDAAELVSAAAGATLPEIGAVAGAALGALSLIDLADDGVSLSDQRNLPVTNPELFAQLEGVAARYSPVFWQDVSGAFEAEVFEPWKDFFVRYDFDVTPDGPNWPDPPSFQDEIKRTRNQLVDVAEQADQEVAQSRALPALTDETSGVFQAVDSETGDTLLLDLRPFVYWTALTTETHFYLHYVVFHAEDWKGMFGHTGDMEGATIVVDRETEAVVAVFTLAHDDVDVTRSLDEEPENNIGILLHPELESRGLLDPADDRPIDGIVGMDVTRGGLSPKNNQDVFVESKGHGQYGPKDIKESRYIIYANYFDDSTFTAPSFDPAQYPVTDQFAEVLSKHKYELIYIGAEANEDATLWGEYSVVGRFSGGVNPPWAWRDNWFMKTGWWKNPRRIKGFGSDEYRINPYLEAD